MADDRSETPAWRGWLKWALHRPLLWALAVLPLLPLAGAGHGVGLPSLYYDGPWFVRIVHGFALGAHASQLWFVAYLLARQDQPQPTRIVAFARVVLGAWASLLTVSMVVGVARGRADWIGAGFLWIAAMGFALLLGAAQVAAERRSAARPVRRALVLGGTTVGQLDRLQLRVSGAVWLLWGLLSLVENVWHSVTGALAVLIVAVLAISSYGFVRYWFREYRVLVYALALGVAATCSVVTSWREEIPGLLAAGAPRPSLPQHGAPPHDDTLLDDVTVLERWRDDRDDAKLVVIATSGGGIRAAAWTAHVLGTLERDPVLDGFAHDVRTLFGASGGMVGAATWVSTMVPRSEAPVCGRDSACLHRGHDVFADAARDSLDAVAAHFALAVWSDRGIALERAWVRNTGGALARPLVDLGIDEQAGELPSLVFAPVIVEDGRRVLISNLGLHPLTHAIDPWPDGTGGSDDAALAAIELFDVFPDRRHLEVATAARLSASFPYVSPFPHLPVDGAAPRLADAGLYDPQGVDLAVRWIASHADWIARRTRGVVLIQIRDDATPRTSVPAYTDNFLVRATQSLAGPPQAILAAREAVGALRGDHDVDALRHRFDELVAPGFFETVVFARSGEASLSWRLSAREKEAIRASLSRDQHCVPPELAELDPEPPSPDDTCPENLVALFRLQLWWRAHAAPP